eukprot:NODE_226_length_13883_cov_0.528729.p3 type:complete len:482 gc:universal NODE_226_length_13883_cov_0.528729:11002-12447(+)
MSHLFSKQELNFMIFNLITISAFLPIKDFSNHRLPEVLEFAALVKLGGISYQDSLPQGLLQMLKFNCNLSGKKSIYSGFNSKMVTLQTIEDEVVDNEMVWEAYLGKSIQLVRRCLKAVPEHKWCIFWKRSLDNFKKTLPEMPIMRCHHNEIKDINPIDNVMLFSKYKKLPPFEQLKIFIGMATHRINVLKPTIEKEFAIKSWPDKTLWAASLWSYTLTRECEKDADSAACYHYLALYESIPTTRPDILYSLQRIYAAILEPKYQKIGQKQKKAKKVINLIQLDRLGPTEKLQKTRSFKVLRQIVQQLENAGRRGSGYGGGHQHGGHHYGGHQHGGRQKSKVTKDYYKVLDVEPSASTAEIKSAYRKLAKKYHPDLYKKQDGDTEETVKIKMQGINEAYDVLKDPEKKKLFDQGIDPNDPNANNRGHPGANPFDMFFGGGGRGGQRGGNQFVFTSGGGFPDFEFPQGGSYKFNLGGFQFVFQ